MPNIDVISISSLLNQEARFQMKMVHYYLIETVGDSNAKTWLVAASTREEGIERVPGGTGRAKVVGQTAEAFDREAPLVTEFHNSTG